MEEAPGLRWQGHRDNAIRAIADGRFEEAEQGFTAALDLAERVESNDERIATTLHDLVALYARRIEQLTDEWFALQREVRQGVGERGALQQQWRTILKCYRQQLECYQRILSHQERTLGTDHLGLADTLLAMVDICWSCHDEFEVFPLEQRALEIRERVLGRDHPDTLAVVRKLAHDHTILSGFSAAVPLWCRLLENLDRNASAGMAVDVEEWRVVLHELGKAYNALSDHVAAERIWRRYLAALFPAPSTFSPGNPSASDFPSWLRLDGLYGAGRACSALGKWDEAEVLLREAVAVHQRNPWAAIDAGWRHLGLDAGLHDYAQVLRVLGRTDEVLPLFEEAVATNRQRDMHFARLLRDYAGALRDLHRVDEAEDLERRAVAVESEGKGRSARFRKPGR